MRTAVIINDCRDDNAAARQVARVSALLDCHTVFIGVKNDLEAAGNIVDALDALGGHEGVVLCNIAPRSGAGQKPGDNGSPFGFFYYGNTVVVTTIGGLTLSLIKKLAVTSAIHVCDFRKIVYFLRAIDSLMPSSFYESRVLNTQFRSFEFSPYLALYLATRHPKGLPDVTSALPIEAIPDAPAAVWWVDNFGNCKTTLLKEDLLYLLGNLRGVTLAHAMPYRPYLKDLLHFEAAYVEGSSGLSDKRFIEIVVRGENAAIKFNLQSGSSLLR